MIFEVPILVIPDHHFLIIVIEINVRGFNLFRVFIEIYVNYEFFFSQPGFQEHTELAALV